MDDSKTIINLLRESTARTAISIWIPSLDRDVQFKPLSVSQQRDLLKISLQADEHIELNLNEAFLNILKENCVDTSVNMSRLRLTDKDSLILGYRCSINPLLTDIQNNVSIDLNEIYIKLKNIYKSLQLNSSIVHDNINVRVGVPTLQSECTTYTPLPKTDASQDERSEYMLKAIFTDIARYIQTVCIHDTSIDIESLDKDSIEQIFDNLPYSIVTDIYSYITEIRNIRNQVIAIRDKDNSVTNIDISLLVAL